MLDRVDFSEELEDAEELYDKLLKEYAKFSKLARTGDRNEIQKYIKRFKQDNFKSKGCFALAMDWFNIISPRYYIDGVDITDAMREFLASEDMSAYSDWNTLYEDIREFEKENISQYAVAYRSPSNDKDNIYEQYFKRVKELNSFCGKLNATREEKVTEFRALVEKTIEARKKCQIIINFNSGMIPVELRKTYTKKSLSFEDAYETCQDIISNVKKAFYGTDDTSMDGDGKELLDDKSNRALEPNQGVKRILKFYITRYLEDDCGVSRRLYTKYNDDPKYLPIKKLVLALAAYCEPYANLEGKDDECHICENVESFMNQHSMTLNSFFETITEFDEMTDEDAKALLEDGLPLDSFAFMLKTFAGTYKDKK